MLVQHLHHHLRQPLTTSTSTTTETSMPSVLSKDSVSPSMFLIERRTTHPGAEDFSVEINKEVEVTAVSNRPRRRPRHLEIQKYVSTTSSMARMLDRVAKAVCCMPNIRQRPQKPGPGNARERCSRASRSPSSRPRTRPGTSPRPPRQPGPLLKHNHCAFQISFNIII